MADRWSVWWDNTILQYAAVSTLTSKNSGVPLAEKVLQIAERIQKRSGWFGELNGNLRFIIAAILEQHGDDPDDYMDEIERARKLFRQWKIRRGGINEILAITMMRLCGKKNGRPRSISEQDLDRFKEIYQGMSANQWWLTSIDDFPAIGVLVTRPESPAEICSRTEEIYQALVAHGFRKGNPLQAAANQLYLLKDHPAGIANRFHQLAEAFRARKVRIWQSEYDELSILCFCDQPPATTVDNVLQIRQELTGLKPRIIKPVNFNLACTLCFLDRVHSTDRGLLSSAKSMLDANALIAAQQAAIMAASVAATVAATSAATSSG